MQICYNELPLSFFYFIVSLYSSSQVFLYCCVYVNLKKQHAGMLMELYGHSFHLRSFLSHSPSLSCFFNGICEYVVKYFLFQNKIAYLFLCFVLLTFFFSLMPFYYYYYYYLIDYHKCLQDRSKNCLFHTLVNLNEQE